MSQIFHRGEILKKRGPVLLGLGILLLIGSYLIPFQLFLPAWTHWDGTFDLGPGKRNGPYIGLYWGSMVRGMLLITGANNDIELSIENINGRVIIPARIVADTYYFEFTSPDNSMYHFTFSNNMSINSSKSVYWIVWAYWYNLVFLAFGFLFLSVGIVMTLRDEKIFQELETVRTDAPQSLPPPSPPPKTPLPEALEILKLRLSKGEITPKEYEKLKKLLEE